MGCYPNADLVYGTLLYYDEDSGNILDIDLFGDIKDGNDNILEITDFGLSSVESNYILNIKSCSFNAYDDLEHLNITQLPIPIPKQIDYLKKTYKKLLGKDIEEFGWILSASYD